jgi:hypothetical protein
VTPTGLDEFRKMHPGQSLIALTGSPVVELSGIGTGTKGAERHVDRCRLVAEDADGKLGCGVWATGLTSTA